MFKILHSVSVHAHIEKNWNVSSRVVTTVFSFLDSDWNLYKSQTVESERLHRQIIQWFGDQPSDMSPFSLHHLVEIGKRGGKRAGDWFGPASVAHIIK